MAWTQTDIDRLKAAIGSGVLTVHYDGPPKRTLTYQNTGDMLKVLSLMQREVQGDAATYRLAATRKGV